MRHALKGPAAAEGHRRVFGAPLTAPDEQGAGLVIVSAPAGPLAQEGCMAPG
ncbi:hypothetical protein [Deinococcus wulumuqiensis]|uniref:hypothetical protein n=1 Tax=Deinococcus wulumuqiensis TaxID=980427 RepID=UPI0013764389|nr:hypothetical protein [Deinococcus wulumuqiensis]QII21098.1 hypothetical protein G6R31_10290 [Deinococcus wulumuqiensis R12]